MDTCVQGIPSPSALPETIRYYIERNPGNILVPLIPVDQLLYQPQGVPSQLSEQQVSEENWQRLTGATEAAIVLPGLPRLSMSPTYRAPDYNVMRDEAVQASGQGFGRDLFIPSTGPTMSVKQRECKQQQFMKKEKNTCTELNVPSKSINAAPIVQRSHVIGTEIHGVQYDSANGPMDAHAAINRQPLVPTNSTNSHMPVRGAPLPDVGEDVTVTPHASNDAALESNVETACSHCSRFQKDQFTADISDDSKLRILGLRTIPTRSNSQNKIFCTHWISTGECSWGFRCRYKHEMPPLDVLKKETGFHTVPRWYKEKMAIQSRGPTWIERRMHTQNENAGSTDDTETQGPREFPDPSTLKSLQRESEGAARQGVRSKRAVKERDTVPSLIDFDRPTLPMKPIAHRTSAQVVAQVPSPTIMRIRKKNSVMSTLRRHSQISWSSDTTDSSLPARQRFDPKSPPKEARQVTTSQSNRGLAASKYAPAHDEALLANIRRGPTQAQNRLQNQIPTNGNNILMTNTGANRGAAMDHSLL